MIAQGSLLQSGAAADAIVGDQPFDAARLNPLIFLCRRFATFVLMSQFSWCDLLRHCSPQFFEFSRRDNLRILPLYSDCSIVSSIQRALLFAEALSAFAHRLVQIPLIPMWTAMACHSLASASTQANPPLPTPSSISPHLPVNHTPPPQIMAI